MSIDKDKLTAAFGADLLSMPDTESGDGNGKCVVIAVTNFGRVGFHNFTGKGKFRVRVEPTDDAASERLRPYFPQANAGLPKDPTRERFCWLPPGREGRTFFSTVANSETVRDALIIAITALLGDKPNDVVIGNGAWAAAVVEEAAAEVRRFEELKRGRLVKMVREAKLPGCNAASRWTTATLLRKFVFAMADGKA
jgi:hypothetical protein